MRHLSIEHKLVIVIFATNITNKHEFKIGGAKLVAVYNNFAKQIPIAFGNKVIFDQYLLKNKLFNPKILHK